MTWIITMLAGKLLPLLGGAIAIAIAFFGFRKGYIRKGQNIEKAKQAEATRRLVNTRDKIHEEVASLSEDERRKGLDKWVK